MAVTRNTNEVPKQRGAMERGEKKNFYSNNEKFQNRERCKTQTNQDGESRRRPNQDTEGKRRPSQDTEGRRRPSQDIEGRRKSNQEGNSRFDGKERSYRKDDDNGSRQQYKPRPNKFAYKDKDDDYDAKPKTFLKKESSKPKVQQPDKFEIVKRIEKEQKRIKKKNESSQRKSDQQKPQSKVKRANNKNYMLDYENGTYEDYESNYD